MIKRASCLQAPVAVLTARHVSRATRILPTAALARLVIHGPTEEFLRLCRSLDADGMRHPVLTFRCPWLEFVRYRRLHDKHRGDPEPERFEPGDYVFAVKRGNQRVAYALERGYRYIAADVYETEHEIELAHVRHDEIDAEAR